MENHDLLELHLLASTTFQNVQNLLPSLRNVVVNAKAYQKSIQTSCNLAVMFIESIQNISNAACMSEGSTKKIGEVLSDIIDAFKEIENIRLELSKLFINEVIIPLESKAEVEISNTKSSHKSYISNNKSQVEVVDKAKAGANKYRKKSMKKKSKSPKLEEKEKKKNELLTSEERKLKDVRESALRKALTDERRMYCFVADRMVSYGKGLIVFNNRMSNFLHQKIPDWQQFISKPTELPPESERIITNPSGYKMGSVRRKVHKTERRDTLKRGKSFSLHYPNKYSTYDGRASRGNSRPSLAALTIKSTSNISDFGTPKTLKSSSNEMTSSPSLAIRSGSDIHSITSDSSGGVTQPTNTELQHYDEKNPTISAGNSPVSTTTTPSEYANVISLHKMDNSQEQTRSHSFSMPKKDQYMNFTRTASVASEIAGGKKTSVISNGGEDTTDFATKLSIIQDKLNQKNDLKQNTPVVKNLKAKYDHTAQDASQLTFTKGDVIIPACEPTSGWQYGENEKTKKSGWYPASYVEENYHSPNNDASGVTLKSKFARPSSTSSKKPPPVAKKTFHGPSRRKTTVTGVPSMTSSNVSKDDQRRSSSAEPPSQITGSSSVPQMIHILSNGETGGSEPKRKQSSSMNDIETNIQPLNSTSSSVSTDQSENTPTAPIVNGVDDGIVLNISSGSPPPPESALQGSLESKITPSPPSGSKHKKRSYDMPPPPPPPELLEGVENGDDETFIIIQPNSATNSQTAPKKKLSTFGN